MKLYLYNEQFFVRGRFKRFVKGLIGKSYGGPLAVEDSLTRGLTELGQEFMLNAAPGMDATVGVLNGVKALAWAISQKQRGRLAHLVAGPNIVVMPKDAGGILAHPAIDRIIVPTLWVKERYAGQAPELKNKIFVWAAGVNIPPESSPVKRYDFLVLDKIADKGQVKNIVGLLRENNFSFFIMRYGQLSQSAYFSLLSQSRALIYLSRSESQGLALFEAWARNVPTLVCGKQERDFGQTSAAPYLAPECGIFFEDADDLNGRLPDFFSQSFLPRAYVKKNFSNKIAAQKYLDIINF